MPQVYGRRPLTVVITEAGVEGVGDDLRALLKASKDLKCQGSLLRRPLCCVFKAGRTILG